MPLYRQQRYAHFLFSFRLDVLETFTGTELKILCFWVAGFFLIGPWLIGRQCSALVLCVCRNLYFVLRYSNNNILVSEFTTNWAEPRLVIDNFCSCIHCFWELFSSYRCDHVDIQIVSFVAREVELWELTVIILQDFIIRVKENQRAPVCFCVRIRVKCSAQRGCEAKNNKLFSLRGKDDRFMALASVYISSESHRKMLFLIILRMIILSWRPWSTLTSTSTTRRI